MTSPSINHCGASRLENMPIGPGGKMYVTYTCGKKNVTCDAQTDMNGEKHTKDWRMSWTLMIPT